MRHKSLSVSMVVLGVGLAISVWGDSTTLNISGGTDTVTSPASTILNFPISRGGDTSFDAFVQFQTVDGTAVAGVDYTAASGSVVIPAGQSSAMIPVTVAGRFNNPANKTFQMQLLGGGGAGMGFTSSFATQQTFSTGSSPVSVTTADLNGDGLPDLIVVNQSDDTVSVLLNTTTPGAITPSFTTQQTFAVGSGASFVTADDVNGDGKLDLIVANEGDNTVSVLLNTTAPGAATPSFSSQQTFAVGSHPNSVTAADVNGDGRPDLIVSNVVDNTVSVLLNTTAPGAAAPSFAAQQTFATGGFPFSVTAADINGDGKPDLVVANLSDGTVSVLLNATAPGATAPSFATQQTFFAGSGPSSVTAADLNGDGKPDLIVTNQADQKTVSVLLNTTAPGAATANFATQQTFGTGNDPASVTAVDLNGDGRADLIVANSSDNTVSVLLNTTAPGAITPSFATQQTFAASGDPVSVTAADVNGDGKPDLIATNLINNKVSVLLNTMAAPATTFDGNSFAPPQAIASGQFPVSVVAADVNGDGKSDLIVANTFDNTVSVLLNTTTRGATTSTFATRQSFATGTNPNSVTVADINGDGKPDIIVPNYSDNTVSVLLNTTAPGASTPSFATQETFATGSFTYWVTAVDVNGDGKPDLIVANQGDDTVSVLLNTTAPGAITPSFAAQQTFAVGSNPRSVAAADLNGDGAPDLIVANQNDNTLSVLLNTTAPGAATPSFAPQQTFGITASTFPYSVTTADVNGDGLPDVIVTNAGVGGPVSVLLNTTAPGAATASFATQQTFAVGNDPYSVTTADIDGDGKPDVIVANIGGNVSVLLNTTAPGATTPSFAPQQMFAAGNQPFSVAAADLNGDGKPDLIVVNGGGSTVSVLLNTLYATIASGSPATGTIHYVIPQTTASLTALAFGNVPVGDAVTKNITVKNTGHAALFVGSVTSNNAEFAATGATTCPSGGLAPGMTCTIAVGFTPNALGPHSATLSVNDNTASSPQHVAASGTGVADMTVTPTSAMFTSTKIGSTKTKTITVGNKQNVQVSLSEGFSGTNSADFSVTGGTCTSTLGAKTSCTLIVTYAPTALGTESATMTVTDNPDTLGPYTVSFTTAENIPATVIPASTLAFGTTTARTPTKTKNITVTNLSGFSLAVSESFSGPNAGDFAVTGGTCGASVAANSTCTIAITFTPTLHATAESASIAVSIGSDPGSPHNIALTGTGP